jgi:hypothetical protein
MNIIVNLIDQAVMQGFSAVDKRVEENFSSVFSKEDVIEILKIAKYDMSIVLEEADPTMLLNPNRVYEMRDIITTIAE